MLIRAIGLAIIIIVILLLFRFVFSKSNLRSQYQRNNDRILHNFVDWWHQTCQEAKCANLRRELLRRLHNRWDTAERLLALARHKYPGKPEYWYLEKVIFDLKRGR
jgi:hypothetical protein